MKSRGDDFLPPTCSHGFSRSPAARSEFPSVSNMISETGDAGHQPSRLEPQPLLPDSAPVDQTREWTG